jgi:HEAT repeat protein
VAPLIEALSDPEALVRLAAVQALGIIGPPAKPAVPTLWRLIRDPDETVREAALRAIKRIRG